MKSKFLKGRLNTRLAAAFLCSVAFNQGLRAQDAELHPHGLFETPQLGLAAESPRTPSDAEGWKERTHLSLSASATYNDNIFLTKNNKESDVIFSISPTLSFVSAERGTAVNTFSITYTPSYRFYTDHSGRNTLDHSLSFDYGRNMPRTTIGFRTTYLKSTGSDRFVSGTIDRETLRSTLDISYILTGKTRLDASAYYSMSNFSSGALFDESSYGLRLALMYQVTGKITLGPYVDYSSSIINGGNSDHSSIGYGIRGTYKVSGKLSLVGSIGQSIRSFSGSGASSDLSFVSWSLGANYQATGKTSLRASIYRSAKASYNFADSGYISTGLALSATHRASSRLSYYATLAYENDDYFEATNASTVGSLDNDYYSATVGLRYKLENGLTLGAHATYRLNDSNISNNDFDNVSFGLSVGYVFW